MNKEQGTMERARQHIQDHLTECCSELIRWQAGRILDDGRIREVASIIEEIGISSTAALSLAENMVNTAAILFTFYHH